MTLGNLGEYSCTPLHVELSLLITTFQSIAHYDIQQTSNSLAEVMDTAISLISVRVKKKIFEMSQC
jgi:hypothetical protein